MGEADFRGGESLKKEIYLETVGFRKEEIHRIRKVAKDQGIDVKAIIREAALEYVENYKPNLKGWRIPKTLFVTLIIPESVRKKLELWQTLKHEMNVSVDERGLVILDETGMDEYSKQRFVLMKVPGSWEKEKAADASPTEVKH
jgi:hypothetical protein